MFLSRNLLKGVSRSTASSAVTASTSALTNRMSLDKNTGVTLAGVFISAGVITAVALSLPSSGGKHSVASTTPQPDSHASIKVNVDSNQSPAADTETPIDESEGSSTSTSMSRTTNDDGSVSTQVTVNGQPVAVPDNGTVQKTVSSPDGNTSVSVTHGSSSNLNSSTTSLNVYSSTNSFTSGGH